MLVFGFLAVAVLNIVVFLLGLLSALPRVRSAKSEEELEHAAVPALTGQSADLEPRTTLVLRALVGAALGFAAVGFCLALWQFIAR